VNSDRLRKKRFARNHGSRGRGGTPPDELVEPSSTVAGGVPYLVIKAHRVVAGRDDSRWKHPTPDLSDAEIAAYQVVQSSTARSS
jgi:hypothetical protein